MDLSYVTHSFDSQTFLSTLAQFIHRLAYYQHRQFKTAPNKAKSRLRLVAGLNQIMSHFKSSSSNLLKPIKMLIAATDLTDDFLIQRDWIECLQIAHDKLIPVIYGFPRKHLASLLSGRKELAITPLNGSGMGAATAAAGMGSGMGMTIDIKSSGTSVTIIAILSTDGAHQEYTILIDEHERLSNLWKEQLIGALKLNANMNLLWYVAAYGHIGILREVVLSFPKSFIQEMINYTDSASGMTMLHISSARGHEKIVSYLLDLGFDPKEKDFAFRTALHYAALYGHNDMIQSFLSRENPSFSSCFHIKDANGMEPLALSASVGYLECVKRLLSKNVDRKMIERALEQAAFLKDPSICQILIDKLFELERVINQNSLHKDIICNSQDSMDSNQNPNHDFNLDNLAINDNNSNSIINDKNSNPNPNSIPLKDKKEIIKSLSINILINAVKSNSLNTLQKIISLFLETDRINEIDPMGRTAIWWSAYLQHYDLYLLLRKLGGDSKLKSTLEGKEYSAEDLYELRTA